jgi:hypothetical protein
MTKVPVAAPHAYHEAWPAGPSLTMGVCAHLESAYLHMAQLCTYLPPSSVSTDGLRHHGGFKGVQGEDSKLIARVGSDVLCGYKQMFTCSPYLGEA